MTKIKKFIESAYFPFVLALLLITLNVMWIFTDNHVWPWDQAWYGQVSVDLYYQATHSFSGWWRLMITAFGMKAPAIAWFGQLFIPLETIFGSIDRSLLMFIVIVQLLSLALLYKLLLLLTRGDKVIALLGCIGMASAPLFIGMGNQYFVESLQLFAVVAFIYIFIAMERWNTYDVILALLFITSFAIAVKITSPLYIFLLSLVMLPRLRASFSLSTITMKEYFENKTNVLLYTLVFIFLFLTASWYVVNWMSIYSFMQLASSGSAAELYGSRAPFFDKMILWLSFSQKSFFFPVVGYFIGLLAGLYSIKMLFLGKKLELKESLLGLPFISIASLVMILMFFSLQINEETRYLLPALPYFIILLCWFVYRINSNIVKYASLFVFFIQFIVIQSMSIGLIEKGANKISVWVNTPYTNADQKNNIRSVIQNTCTLESANKTNILGVEFPSMNANSLSYYISQEKIRTNLTCYYTSLGYAESDIDKAMKRLYDINPPYFIGVTAEKLPKKDAFNAVSFLALEAIERDKNFSELKLQDIGSVRIFKNLTVR